MSGSLFLAHGTERQSGRALSRLCEKYCVSCYLLTAASRSRPPCVWRSIVPCCVVWGFQEALDAVVSSSAGSTTAGALGWNLRFPSRGWTLGDFVSSVGGLIIITLVHMKKMLYKAIVRDLGRLGSAVDLACLEGLGAIKIDCTKPQSYRRWRPFHQQCQSLKPTKPLSLSLAWPTVCRTRLVEDGS